MRVAAYQAPYLPFGSFDAVELIRQQLSACEAAGVDVLCCPEAVIGGLAHESDGQSPADVALEVASGELADVLAPLMSTTVALVVGFTEREASGDIFSAAAVIAGGTLIGVQRKAYPGYRTVVQGGSEMTTFTLGAACCGVLICNDLWYLEPARILAAAGAAVLFAPSNSGHIRHESVAQQLRLRGENLPIARAVENSASVVVADIAGRQDTRSALGCSLIVGPDGELLAHSDPDLPDLLMADVESRRPPGDPRGWDGHTNAAITEAFVSLWRPGPPQVVAGLLVRQGRVLLGHRSADRRWYPDVWDLPGGHVEVGESPADALARELREELGIVVDVPCTPESARITTADFDMRVWLIEQWGGEVANEASDEHDQLSWFAADQLAGLDLAHESYLALLTDALGRTGVPWEKNQ